MPFLSRAWLHLSSADLLWVSTSASHHTIPSPSTTPYKPHTHTHLLLSLSDSLSWSSDSRAPSWCICFELLLKSRVLLRIIFRIKVGIQESKSRVWFRINFGFCLWKLGLCNFYCLWIWILLLDLDLVLVLSI